MPYWAKAWWSSHETLVVFPIDHPFNSIVPSHLKAQATWVDILKTNLLNLCHMQTTKPSFAWEKNDANSPLPCKIPCHFPPFPLWVLKALGCFLLHLRKFFLENLWSSWRSKNGSCNFFLTPFPTTTLWIFQKCHHLLPLSIFKLWLKIHVWPFLKAKNNAKKNKTRRFTGKSTRACHSRETNPRAWAFGVT